MVTFTESELKSIKAKAWNEYARSIHDGKPADVHKNMYHNALVKIASAAEVLMMLNDRAVPAEIESKLRK